MHAHQIQLPAVMLEEVSKRIHFHTAEHDVILQQAERLMEYLEQMLVSAE